MAQTQRHILIFLKAQEVELDQRAEFLDSACQGDELLISRVNSLFDVADESNEYFDSFSESLLTRQLNELAEFQARGDRIGNYQIEHLLTQGGMGAVYVATRADGHFDRTVIIKMLPLAFESAELAERFADEQRTLAALSHPNIAQLFDAGVDAEHGAYFVMEFIDGKTIMAHCDHYKLDESGRIDLFLDLLDAVQFAHRNLVVHSDIKPSNVMVTHEGDVKLLDFGIAKSIKSERPTPEGKEYSLDYAAPEQLLGGRITTATDTYQCGQLLFEMLSGQVFSQVKDAAAHTGALSPDLQAILHKSFDPDPEQRYLTAKDMTQELVRMRTHLPVDAATQTVGYRTGRFLRRNRLGLSIAAAVFLLSTAFAVAMALQAREIRIERDRVVAASAALAVERDKAIQVTEFLIDVFETANPQNSPGVDLTATEILRNALAGIRHRFAGLESTKIDLLLVMARTFQSLGNFDSASEVLSEAEALLQDGDGSSIRTNLLLHRGENERMQGKLDNAVTTLAQVIASLNQHDESNSIALADAEGKLGRVLGLQGKYAEARTHLESAAQMIKLEYGEHHEDYAQALNDLASVDFSEGNYQAVHKFLTQALGIREQLAVENPNIRLDPAYATNVNNLGLVHFRQGSLDEAENFFRRAVQLRDRIYHQPHTEQAQSLTNLGLVLDGLGRADEALPALQRALEIRQATHGTEHMRVGESLNNLGMLHLSNARFDSALGQFLDAYRIIGRQLGEDHPAVATIASNLGQSYLELGELETARDYYQHSLDVRTAKLPMGHLFISYSEVGLGRTLAALGQTDSALKHLETGLAIREDKLPTQHWLIGEAKLALAFALQDDALPRASQLAAEALAILEQVKGLEHYLSQRAAALVATAGERQ